VTALASLELLHRRDRAYADDLLIAAVAELDVFTWLEAAAPTPTGERAGAGLPPGVTFERLCDELGFAPRPARVLVVLLAALGLIDWNGTELRTSESARRHLMAGAVQDLRPYFASLRGRPAVAELVQVLRTGEPAAWGSASAGTDWATAMTDPAAATQLTAAMDARAAVLAPALAAALEHLDTHHVLDVAGGSGAYAAALVERRPGLRATVLEQPQVAGAVRTLLGLRGLADRIDTVERDAFAGDWPRNCDLHLFSHVLHDWDEPRIEMLLRFSFDALPPGGYVADHDAHLDADESGPLDVAEYSVLLCHSTYGRCYSVREIEALLVRTGFVDVHTVPTAAGRTIVLGRRS
jgi:hypothetical protein